MSVQLQHLWERAHKLSVNFPENPIDSIEFQFILNEFKLLSSHENINLQKIGRLAEIFENHWTHRQWLNLLVPLERFLDRRLTDTDILGDHPDTLAVVQQKLPLIVIADHWRSAFNVGSLFRLSDGFGVNKIYLTGYTPTPEHPSVQKTSMGSLEQTPWEHWESTSELIEYLNQQNYSIWALETSQQSKTLGEVSLPNPMGIILGNERFGLDPKIMKLCHNTIKIPLRGFKNSMNVANCFGIFAYEWCRQHG